MANLKNANLYCWFGHVAMNHLFRPKCADQVRVSCDGHVSVFDPFYA